MNPDKPILIVGAGSIGRRHLRNLKALGHKSFVLYRTKKSTLPDKEIAHIPTEYSLSKALAHKPIATIISNPTSLHLKTALAAAKAGSHLFLEKPISDNLKGLEELQRLVKEKKLIVAVGYQFRFHPILKKIKRMLEKNEIGQVYSVQAHWGEYLPSWHPWEDYRKSYSAKKELGGGVILTLCHPFDYLKWLIGDVSRVFATENHSGGLEINVEDNADILLTFKSGVLGNVHLDYLEHPTNHFINIVGEKGVIHWDSSEPKNFERNQMFLDEIKHFLSCIITGKHPVSTLDDGIEALRIILAAKKSAKNGRMVKLNERNR